MRGSVPKVLSVVSLLSLLSLLATLLLPPLAPPAVASAGSDRVPGIQRFAEDLPGSTGQVVVVRSSSWSTSYATLTTYERRADGWVRVHGPWAARLGSAGMMRAEDRVAGNRTTPAGAFAMTETFGRLADPGTDMPYVTVGPDHYWVGDPASVHYNDMRLGSQGGFRTSMSERLAGYDPQYNYSAVIDFNRPRTDSTSGSAIFLHVSGAGATLGCVSISQSRLATVLRWLDPDRDPQMVMGPDAWLREGTVRPPAPVVAPRTSELFLYSADDGRRAQVDIRPDGATPVVGAGTWTSGWSHMSAVETDGTTGSELLTYDSRTGRRAVNDLRADGSHRYLSGSTWTAGYTHVTPVETDGTRGSELLLYSASTGRRAVLDLLPNGSHRFVSGSTWASGHTHLTPVETDGTARSELLVYSATTGRRVLLDLAGNGSARTVADSTWATGHTHLSTVETDGTTGSELFVYSATTGRRVVLDLAGGGGARTVSDARWTTGRTQVLAVETDGS